MAQEDMGYMGKPFLVVTNSLNPFCANPLEKRIMVDQTCRVDSWLPFG